MSYKNNIISSDDPQAIEKLTEKLQKCEKEQDFMKKANAYYKKNGTTKGCDGISDELAAKLDARVQESYSWDKQPFPSYRITNNGAEIRRIKKRIENIEANKGTEFVGWKFNGGEAVINEDKTVCSFYSMKNRAMNKEQHSKLTAFGGHRVTRLGSGSLTLTLSMRQIGLTL